MSEWNSKSKLTAGKLENYIINTKWEDFPKEIQDRAITCTVDLFDVMIACSQTLMAKNGIRLSEDLFARGSIPVIGTTSKMNIMGAVTAYGYNVNALDIDDGHNMIKGHPGAVLMAGLWPAALKVGATYKEFLEALVVGYEVSVRAGLALHKYYGFYHGTGSWGAFGVAAGIAKLYKLDKKTLGNALGIADYQAPIAPIMRIVEIPSMNKDGIAWGAITGAMAVESAVRGITGQFYNLLESENQHLVDTLGKEYEIMNIYFKYFPCCRWAHAPVVCALGLREKNDLRAEDIEKIYIKTFKAATQLSSVIPKLCDEAQYNMVYPVCAALIEGKFTPVQDSEEYLKSHPEIIKLMGKVEFAISDEFEAQFPRKRFAQLEVIKKNGEKLISEIEEPLGEQEHNVDLEWVTKKFVDVSGHCFPVPMQEKLIKMLRDPESPLALSHFVDFVNKEIKW